MQTYDCHACYVRNNEVDELTKNFKEAYGLLLARNNVLSAENKIAKLRITELEKDIPWFFDRIAELEQENIEFIDVNIYEHSVAEKAKDTIKQTKELVNLYFVSITSAPDPAWLPVHLN